MNEIPRNKSTTYSQPIFDKVPRTHIGERTVVSINGAGESAYNIQKDETSHLILTICKVNSNWIKVLDVRPETMRLLEENGGNASGHWDGQEFGGQDP